MKAYCQFFKESSGYVRNSMPPRFEKSNIEPIEMCGTDGVMVLDARKSVSSLIGDCMRQIVRLKAVHKIIGFKIYKSERFDSQNCVYTNIRSLKFEVY